MQRTTNYGLCQYEGSDKTSYLVNYNDDMLKIDTAIKNAADAGSGAGTAAERAQSTADDAAESVSTLNTQINGATGLAADVSTLQGSVGSINSLIGNGTPTTSDQTIIGAINGLEGAIAPREDGADLANSYVIGEQFARGGSIFTALTTLTAGTAFASLTLNTDYKVSDTIVEQIADVQAEAIHIDGKYLMQTTYTTFASVNVDGVKTLSTLMGELATAFNAYLAALDADVVAFVENFNVKSGVIRCDGLYPPLTNQSTFANIAGEYSGIRSSSGNTILTALLVYQGSISGTRVVIDSTGTATVSDLAAFVPDSGAISIQGYLAKHIA